MRYQHIVFDHDGTLVHPDSLQLYPGIKNLLSQLKAAGAKMYVWTARNRYSTVEILRTLAIIQYFEELSTSTDCESKPSAQGLRQMLEDYAKDDIVVIGDSFADMIGARNFQVAAIGANWHDASEESNFILRKYGAKEVFTNITQLQEYLLSEP